MRNAAMRDFEPKLDAFYDQVMRGLQQSRKTLPCKFFYDERGSQLFDRICEIPEYYPTRTEVGIMQANIGEMAALLGSDCRLIEYGSGSSLKTRILLDHAPELNSYIPVDISREHLHKSALSLAQSYPHVAVTPVCADYTQEFTLPVARGMALRNLVYFPGSTIGNFPPDEASEFLARIAALCGQGGGLLIGVDLRKSFGVLEAAYNDAQGVTAEFNLNLLRRINRELDGNFDLSQWRHHALYDPLHGRIEMHLVSLRDQQVRIGPSAICFNKHETIHTESSYKYSVDGFASLANHAGWTVKHVWTDPESLFSVQYLATDQPRLSS